MRLVSILINFFIYAFLHFLTRLLRLVVISQPESSSKNSATSSSVSSHKSFSYFYKFFPEASSYYKQLTLKLLTNFLNIRVNSVKSKDNIYLFRLLCFFLRVNINKDTEFLVLKSLNLDTEIFSTTTKNGYPAFKHFLNDNSPTQFYRCAQSNPLSAKQLSSLENNSVLKSTNQVFKNSDISSASVNDAKFKQSIENSFLANKKTSFDFLASDSSVRINFNALQSLYDYLKMFDDASKLTELNDLTYPKKLIKIKKKDRIPKNFKGGTLRKTSLKNFQTSQNTIEGLKRDFNTLKQLEFLLKNRKFLENRTMKIEDLELSNEVKQVMFSNYNLTGPYGSSNTLYTSDLYSKNKLVTTRRVYLSQNNSPIQNLNDLNQKLGFSNFNFSQNEQWENSADVPLGGWSTGQFYSINPFLVFGFIIYSFLELSLLIYFMSFFFGNPYDTFLFFIKYPLVYFYDNLSFFPSANYFFSGFLFWFIIIFTFLVHLFELIDEERFDPPRLSWLLNSIKDFVHMFLMLWCAIFCLAELVFFFDLLISRVFFIGVPGYPNLFSIVFLFFYDVFYILGCSEYFSFYLKSFVHLDVKFPSFYFSDYSPFVYRYPLVQPYFFGNPYLDRPNFFLWLADSFLNFVSGDTKKKFFFSMEDRVMFQRELIQDIRKYNYIRKNLLDLKVLGQLYSRGWNGFNYRLDLQVFSQPILPSDQMMYFDWRLKNTHSNGMYSRLFSQINFGYDGNNNNLAKKIKVFRGRQLSSRYGYFRYLKSVLNGESSNTKWYTTHSSKKRKLFSRLSHLPEGLRKSKRRQKRAVRSFLFSPVKSKFSMLLKENKRIHTKADRNFRFSHRFKKIWSFIPGNNMPRKFFRFKPFISVTKFLDLSNSNYSKNRSYLKNSDLVKIRNLPIGKYSLRNFHLNNPEVLFPTNIINEREIALKSKNFFKDWKNSKKINNFGHKKILNHNLSKSEILRSFSSFSLDQSNFMSDQKLKSSKVNDLSLNSSDYFTKRRRNKSKIKNSFQSKFPIYSRRLKNRRLDLSAIPNFPFRVTKKYKFASKIFQNLPPAYFLKPTAIFTTFSKIHDFHSFNQIFFFGSDQCLSLNNNSGANYNLSVLFLGFGKFLSFSSPIKFITYDYYYSSNHNFMFSLLENYLKQNQFRTILSSTARFNHPLKGGFRHNLDFMYPMLSELRLKEKIVPVDFIYNSRSFKNYKHLILDPYESIRKSFFSKGSCYFLDARIQNWLNFNNIIWNSYFHFFFNRSFKTEGNGAKFIFASYNPIKGPASYKLFIDSPTLQIPRVGHYFYNYISWLQYKFKWLLYPTSTYKRFDSFRFNHQHSNKKFYFTSLLKFYQMNLFRWQQSAQIFQWNQIQSKNFLLHLFFHKYNTLFQIKNFFQNDSPNLFSDSSSFSNYKSNQQSFVDSFNKNFFQIIKLNSENFDFNQKDLSDNSQIFIPSFNSFDFRFFQYVTDLRRWKALQTSFIRDWKFEKYIRYLGPLLYKDDVASLMGFFAPFEYRNQIIVSRLRNDSLRFSVFFPKKVIDEQFSNPTKRLAFPTNKFHRKFSSRFLKNISISKPMYYAYAINRPFLSSASNYSFFSKKGKKIIYGLYPNLQRFNISSNFNLISGDIGTNLVNNSFYEINTKKKKLLKDKDFWFSRIYELQEIRNRLTNSLVNDVSEKNVKIKKFRVVLDQFGKPLDLQVPTSLPRLQLTNTDNENLLSLVDQNFKKNVLDSSINLSNSVKKMGGSLVLPHLYPDIFMRFGGPKASSRRWHMGQSWMKFVIASQNVSVFPLLDTRGQLYQPNQPRLKSSSDDILSSSSGSSGFSGRPYQNRYNMTPEIRDKYGYFNFGLAGIGRLPRLSRSFFHMLFFRNKLDDFKELKTQFLKLYIMSLPIFHNTDFSANSSFKIFWSFFTGSSFSRYSLFNFRYNLLFTTFNAYKLNFDFSTFIHHPTLGTIVSYYSPTSIKNNKFLILHDQYLTFKSFEKFKIFQSFRFIETYNNVSKEFFFSSSSYSYDNFFLFLPIKETFSNILQFFYKFINNFFTNVFFKFFNYFFLNYHLLMSKNNTYLTFFNFDFQTSLDSAGFSFSSKFNQFNYLNKSFNYSLFFKNGFFYSDFDIFHSRLYHGSFRSKLHWYYFPVQYYMFFQYWLSQNCINFFFELLNFGIKINSKYGSSFFPFSLDGFPSTVYSNFFNNNNPLDLNYVINNKLSLDLNSNFLFSFSIIYSNFFKFNSNSFLIRIGTQLENLEFLKNLFLYNSDEFNFSKKFLSYNSFFFIPNSFLSFSKLNNRLNFFYSQKTNFIDNLEIFSDDLFKNSISLDGSGRLNRPKTSSQTLDRIFTYREYEKYRHEHHRQRFRGVTPHWIQNTFKNRTNFRYFYRSADKRKRIMTRVLLNRMFQYVKQSRSRFSPKRLNRISFNNSLNNFSFMKDLLTKDLVKYDKKSSSNNSALLGHSSLQHAKFVNSSKFDKSYSHIKRKRVNFIDSLFNEYVTPVSTGLRRDDNFLKYKKYLKQHSHNNFTFSSFFETHDIRDFDDRPKFPYWYGSSKKKNKYVDSPVFLNSNSMHKRMVEMLFNRNNFSNFQNTSPRSSKNLGLITDNGFYRNGGNFVNTKNYSSLNNLFISPTSYSLKRKDGFFTGERYVRQSSGAYDPKIDYPPVRQSLKQSMIEPYYRTSPRYLRTLRSRKHIANFLPSNTIGGLHSHKSKNPYMNPSIWISDLKKNKRRKFRRKHLYKYPINIKRFVRPFSKVIMSIPFLYSKWFTQNPRLSMSVNNDYLKIFSNNNYDEFNFICVQSLILLKRKIMFNVVNLRLLSYKHKILYFSLLSDQKYDISSAGSSKNFLLTSVYDFFQKFLSNLSIFYNYFKFGSFFLDLYKLRSYISSFFFTNEFFFVRLLYNPLVSRFKHDSIISSDLLFFENFYYKQSAKMILSQIAFSSHSLGGWNNPLGLSGQYIPGLNFYSKGPIHFNFNYQYPDFFSGRYFSPEILLDNNLIRQNLDSFDRNYLFNEFLLDANYRKSWHFLSFRISSPISPFIEYERPHHLIFQKNIKSKIDRLPLSSLRRIRNIYPNYLKSFFSTLNVENTNIVGHDLTLSLKMKFLNSNLKVHDPFYRRYLNNSLENQVKIPSTIKNFSESLKSKQMKVITDFHNRINISSIVNKRRLGIRKRVWSPFRYNFYYKFNWKTFLHKYNSTDLLGFRNYKLNSYFDMYTGSITRSFKLRAFQHLIISQIPRFEIDSRRNVPLNISSKEFILLFFSYFNHVNRHFSDVGYNSFGNKVFKYVQRKAFPFISTHFLEGSRDNFFGFWNFYDRSISNKITDNYKINSFLFKDAKSKYNLKLAKYDSVGFVISNFKNNKPKISTSFSKSFLFKNFNFLKYSRNRDNYIFKIKYRLRKSFFSVSRKTNRFLLKRINGFSNYLIGSNFASLIKQKSFLTSFVISKFQNSNSYKIFFNKTIELNRELSFFPIIKRAFFTDYRNRVPGYFYRFLNNFPFFKSHVLFHNYSSLFRKFIFSAYSRQGLQRSRFPDGHFYPNLPRRSSPLEFLKDLARPYFIISKIFSVNTLFSLKKSRERSLNPQAWLSFDLFSRIRPSFRPFLYKFSKKLMFSRYMPTSGIYTYNSFIKSHTPRDSFFERHPYISFSIGLKSNNQLISSESMYKEIRKRSQMLDFSRRHLKFLNPLNFSQDNSVFRKRRKKFLFQNFDKKRIKKYRFFSDNIFKFKKRNRIKTRLYRGSFFFLRKMSRHFLVTKPHSFDIDPKLNNFKFPMKLSFGNLFLKYFRHHNNFRVLNKKKKFLGTLPLRYRFNTLFKNANYYSYMVSPRRKRRFLNIFLIKPYNILLKFVRVDNYIFQNLNFFGTTLLKYGSLNLNNNDRLRSFYQPNLKVFFDFNAYKQRYNLGLLFRGLSFENDFQFFLFRRSRLASFVDAQDNLSNYLSFLNFSSYDYFNLLISKENLQKGLILDSKFSYLFFFLQKLFFKLNPFYLLLIFVDFYLGLFYSLFSLMTQLHFFDLSYFVNFFQLESQDSIYYLKKRPIFQLLFHVAFLNEYLKFSWLFSWKFLIFNFDYYPYYFLFFAFLILLRLISFNLKRSSLYSPFIVPYTYRFSDLKLNTHSGWFDDAWSEIKSEALNRLNNLDSLDSFSLHKEHLLRFDDVKVMRRRYNIENEKRNFFQTDSENEDPSKRIDLSKYERASRTNPIFQKPLANFFLKGIMSKLWLPTFLTPSINHQNSDKMKLLDIDNNSKFDDQFDRQIFKIDIESSLTGDKEDTLNLKNRSVLSFFFLKQQLYLLFSGKISFLKFVSSLNLGSSRFAAEQLKQTPHFINDYNMDDFSEEFARLILDQDSELYHFSNQNLKKKRMFSDDENIHFYRKPGSILNSELMARKHGTENDQLYYVVEFPGRFNNTYLNAFSKFHAVRNLNYNSPYYGFFTFSKNAKLPTTFEEFIVFCSNNNKSSNFNNFAGSSENPQNLLLQPNLDRLQQLWTVFQYVTKYEYNMFNEFDFQDNQLLDIISKLGQKNRHTLFDNLKFWLHKASVDAIDLNYLNRRFFTNVPGTSKNEIEMYGSLEKDDEDRDDEYSGVPNEHIQTVTPFYSILYIFYIYLVFFLFFLFLTFFFCFIFLFFFSCYFYVFSFF